MPKKDFLASKYVVYKLDINKLINLPTSLNDLKTNVDNLDVVQLKTTPAVFRKFSHVVDNEVVKDIIFNTIKTKRNSLEKEIPDATTLIHINQYKTDKQNVQKKIGEIDKKKLITSSLVTRTVLTTKINGVVIKIPDTSGLVTTTVSNTNQTENISLLLIITNSQVT